MPTLTEKIDSRERTTGERPSVTMHYVLDGTSDDLTAKTLLLSSTPATYDGLCRPGHGRIARTMSRGGELHPDTTKTKAPDPYVDLCSMMVLPHVPNQAGQRREHRHDQGDKSYLECPASQSAIAFRFPAVCSPALKLFRYGKLHSGNVPEVEARLSRALGEVLVEVFGGTLFSRVRFTGIPHTEVAPNCVALFRDKESTLELSECVTVLLRHLEARFSPINLPGPPAQKVTVRAGARILGFGHALIRKRGDVTHVLVSLGLPWAWRLRRFPPGTRNEVPRPITLNPTPAGG